MSQPDIRDELRSLQKRLQVTTLAIDIADLHSGTLLAWGTELYTLLEQERLLFTQATDEDLRSLAAYQVGINGLMGAALHQDTKDLGDPKKNLDRLLRLKELAPNHDAWHDHWDLEE